MTVEGSLSSEVDKNKNLILFITSADESDRPKSSNISWPRQATQNASLIAFDNVKVSIWLWPNVK